MLNELYALGRALDACGIEREPCASGLEVGRGEEGVRVFLASDGSISRAPEPVSKDQMKSIRKWSTGPGLSLPVYNLDSIYSVTETDFERLRAAWARCRRIPTLYMEPHPASSKLNWPPISRSRSRTKDLQSTLKNTCEQIRSGAGQSFEDGGDAWKVLLEALEKKDPLLLIDQLGTALRKWVRTASCPKWAFGLLYCPEGKSTKTPVQFEPEGVFAAPVYSPKAQIWLTKVRIRYTSEPEAEKERLEIRHGHGKKTDEVAAVWGSQAGCTDAYPQNVDSPIGQLSFFNRDVNTKPTSARYDARYAVFAVGSDKRNELITDFKWLIAGERKGKTWAVRSKCGKRVKITKRPPTFLILSYLSEKTDQTPDHLAELFVGPPDEESDRATVQFETLCADVEKALDGIPGLSDKARIQVFALHKPDGFRVQVFLSDTLTAARLRSLSQQWRTDCRQHPSIAIPQFPVDGGEGRKSKTSELSPTTPRPFQPLVPSPYEAIECLNTIWEKCGKAEDAKCEGASDYDLADAFELLRRTGGNPMDAPYLGRMLDLAVRRALPLVGAVGQAMHQVHQRVFLAQGDHACALKSRLQARRWPCLLSLLLTRIGHQLGTFMKEPAYLIGQFLAQIDRLHAYYANHVSGKDEGLRQLLGNSLMSIALESPLRAFELAGQRMLPYQAWGHSFALGRKSKDAVSAASDEARATNSARWEVHRVLEDLGRIADELSDRGIPEANRAVSPSRAGHEAKAPTKSILDLTDSLKANDRAWMHADSAAKAQMLLGYLARPAREGGSVAGAGKTGAATIPPDFDQPTERPQSDTATNQQPPPQI
jgi:hypothetical protein